MSASSAYQQRLSPVLPSASACVPAAALPSPTSSMPIKIPHATTSSSSSTFTAPRGTPGKARGSVEGLNQVYIVNYYHQLMRSSRKGSLYLQAVFQYPCRTVYQYTLP